VILFLTYLSQVQFRDPATGLDCDINVNDRLGLINSSMIKDYCDAHPFVRPLLYSIKEWAKPLGLNSPSPPRGDPASFSSYAFALMTISFLQVRYIIHFPRFQLLNLRNRKRAICQIYREIFLLLQTNPTKNLYGLVNLIKVGMFAIIQPKNGFRHLFLILIHCCLRGTRMWFFFSH
jgi:DNA polymerase sigma